MVHVLCFSDERSILLKKIMSIIILPPEVSRCRTRGKWLIHCTQVAKHASEGSTLPLSSKVQHRGISGPTKRTDVLPKFNKKTLPHCNNTQDHFQKACVLLLGTCVVPRRLLYTSTCRPQVHWKISAARGNVMVPRGCTPFPARTKHDVVTGCRVVITHKDDKGCWRSPHCLPYINRMHYN